MYSREEKKIYKLMNCYFKKKTYVLRQILMVKGTITLLKFSFFLVSCIM